MDVICITQFFEFLDQEIVTCYSNDPASLIHQEFSSWDPSYFVFDIFIIELMES